MVKEKIMNKIIYKKLVNILIGIGITLIVIAVGLSVYLNLVSTISTRRLNGIVEKIHEILPETTYGTWDNYTNISMPMVEIDGVNFIGLIEIPSCNVELPIYSEWDNRQIFKTPCRYTGSVYDGTLIIGDNDRLFVKQLNINDSIIITDMNGYQYTYSIDTIEKINDVSTDFLTPLNNDLTIFFKESYSLEYVIIRCSIGR